MVPKVTEVIGYDPYIDEVLDDPHAAYRRLRDVAPALYLEQYNAWFLSRFDYVWEALQRPELSVVQGISPSQLLLGAPADPRMPSQMDPPRHTAVRRILSDGHFKPKRVVDIEHDVRDAARARLGAAHPGASFDAVRDYAAPVAMITACQLCGFPPSDAPMHIRWVNKFFHRRPGQRGETERAAEAGQELYGYVQEHLRQVHAHPETMSALTATLLTTPVDGEVMSDDAVVSSLVNLLIAAADTFPKVFGATLVALSEHPADRAAVVHDHRLLLDAFHEALRLDTPTQFQGRTVTAPFEIDGHRFEPAQRVCLLFASANRDPREFADPDSFMLKRRPRRMVGFGHGIHVCLGMHLARMEAQVTLDEFLERLPDYQIDMDRARYARTEYVRGWLRLPVSPGAHDNTGG
jgi:cytochrome P450